MFNNYLDFSKKMHYACIDMMQKSFNTSIDYSSVKTPYLANIWPNNMLNENAFSEYISKENVIRLIKYMIFSLRQIKDANHIDNYFLLNHSAQKKALDTNYQSITKGMQNFINDIQNSSINGFSMKRKNDNFKIGENIAKTKGSIVYKTEILELIAYNVKDSPSYKIPILFVPATINKYYVLDLSEENSLINHLVKQDLQVFCISFNNDIKLRYSFEDCINEIMNVIHFIEKFCDVKKINLLGYCLGGVFSSIVACLIKEKINSITFLNTGLNYIEKADFDFFVNQSLLPMLQIIGQNGYIHGLWMQQLFSYLRSKDTIWKYVQNNYLHGNEPFKSDVMYWNDDSTHQSTKMLLYFIENIYLNNKLTKKELRISGKTIDLESLNIPIFYVGCLKDHIVTKETIIESYKSFPVNKDNILCISGGGHVNGILNPPISNKGFYYLLSQKDYLNFDYNDIENHAFVAKNTENISNNQNQENINIKDITIHQINPVNLTNKENPIINTNHDTKINHNEEVKNGPIKHQGSWWESWSNWLIKNSSSKTVNNVNQKIQEKSIEPGCGKYAHKTI